MGGIALHWQILVALVAGSMAGLLLGDWILHLEFIGTIFLKTLKMIIVPLIAASIISGIAGILC